MPNPSNNPYLSRNRQEVTAESQLWEEALNAFYRDDDETALALLLEVLETQPDNLRAAYLAVLCAANLSDEETVEEVCGAVHRHGARHPYALGCDAVRAMFYANYERAEHLFDLALQALPDDIDLGIGLAILCEQMGQEEKCAELYRRVLERSPDNIRARISLGISYALSGEYLSAFAEYQYAKQLDPSVENPHQHLGRDFYADGLLTEAVQEFLQAIAEEPEQPAAYFFLLDCYRRLGEIDAALDVYQQIRIRFAHEPELMSQFFEQFRMFNEALPLLERLHREHPEDLEILLRLCRAYEETGQPAEALNRLEKSVPDDPEAGPLWSELARLYYQIGEYQSAAAAAKRAVEFNRYDQEAYGVLTDALLMLGKIEEAEAAAQEMERIQDEAWQRYQRRFSGLEEEGED
ncbi:MAG: tetratricopeptide repeat protein [candidate division WOR-3 bacterium]|uniref:Tetratricopeptide repeat protein n=3 Tax=candidate division WOR-3 bacterium TaxID=2052148 RepID=A0A7C3EHC3_UNCW3|nr:tetratricopeptide repeat protein [candidate division WOR-3 bacterium]